MIHNMKTMSNRLRFILLLMLAVTATACSKSEVSLFEVPSQSILLTKPGESGSTTFDTHNITSIKVTSKPAGWSVDNIDMYTGTISVTAPSSFDNDEATEGDISLTGYTPTGSVKTLTIYVAILPHNDIDFTSTPANCYVVFQADRRYKFNPYVGGNNTALATEKVELVWQSSKDLIKYLDLRDGVASFYVESAVDENDTPTNEVTPGNAVIAARNSDGEIIWSWHIWITTTDPTLDVATLNGKTMMNRNLGANCNSEGEANEEKIMQSYGLYYQWGNKNPLPGPQRWDFHGNSDAALYNYANKEYSLKYADNTAECGTEEWSTAHPAYIILGNANNSYDWLYNSHDDSLWNGTSKSEQDPCPAGWRLPDSSVFASLDIRTADDDMAWQEAQKMYGWHLEDRTTGESYFFAAAGRRNYLDGKLDIMNDDATRPVPWSGYYWTTTTDGDNGVALYFDLNTESRTWNGMNTSRSMHRANALPVRCIRE